MYGVYRNLSTRSVITVHDDDEEGSADQYAPLTPVADAGTGTDANDEDVPPGT